MTYYYHLLRLIRWATKLYLTKDEIPQDINFNEGTLSKIRRLKLCQHYVAICNIIEDSKDEESKRMIKWEILSYLKRTEQNDKYLRFLFTLVNNMEHELLHMKWLAKVSFINKDNIRAEWENFKACYIPFRLPQPINTKQGERS